MSRPRPVGGADAMHLPASANLRLLPALGDEAPWGLEPDPAAGLPPLTTPPRRPLARPSWSLVLGTLAGAAVWVAAHQRRARAAAIEGVQTRIVRDLHDELGTSLARLSVLSEVARRQVVTAPERSSAVLDEIGATARQLIRASGDLAVSLDPGRASLGKLLVRLRRVASELLEEAGVRLRIEHRGEDPEHVELSPEQRRHLLAALQEALHNVARHARASWVAIAVATSRSAITVTLADDGCGLPTERSEHGGQGISNVVARALALGGRATVASSPGAGTCWTLEIPRRAPGLLARRRPCPR